MCSFNPCHISSGIGSNSDNQSFCSSEQADAQAAGLHALMAALQQQLTAVQVGCDNQNLSQGIFATCLHPFGAD